MTDMEYEVKYSKRKTLGLSVERDTSIIVRVPEGTHPERIEEFVERKKLWIKDKQSHPQKSRPPRPIKEFVSGESILYLGKSYRLQIEDSDERRVEMDGKFLVCGPKNTNLKREFRSWFVEQAKQIVPDRAGLYAGRMGVRYEAVKILDMKYRWGSCTPARNLTFNWRLIKAPMHVVDYVVVHELAHLLEHNHSKLFWQHVKTQTPNFEASKMWLKTQGQCLDDEF